MTDKANAMTSLIDRAIDASQNAYAPYSNYRVGSALRTTDGKIYTGCNVENASYPVAICAERTALVKAVSEGERSFEAVVVATSNGGSPCGICRQMLFEFSPDLQVIMVDFSGHVHYEAPLKDFLLMGFGPSNLPTESDE